MIEEKINEILTSQQELTAIVGGLIDKIKEMEEDLDRLTIEASRASLGPIASIFTRRHV